MKIIYGLIFLMAIGIILTVGYRFFHKDTIYIAVAGPLTGDNASHGKSMLQGVDLYLEKINQAGGIYGKRVKRLQFDDGGRRCDRVPSNDPAPKKCAREAANEISTSPALAVIGHYSSEPSLEAGEVYKSKGIPVITGTATANDITKDNQWYFRIIFKDSDQAAVIANYARKILGYKAAYIFYDNDSYGRGLEQSFSNTALKIGLRIQNEHKWGFDQKQNSFENTLNRMIETLKPLDGKGILFLATHSTEAIKVIRELRRLPYKLPIIAPEALSSSRFKEILNHYPQEKAFPGYYTDGIYVASPFLLDIAGKQAQHFYQKYEEKYQKEKDRGKDVDISVVTPALYYDATMVAVEAIKQMLTPQEGTEIAVHLEDQRKQVRNHLRQLSRLENAVEGVTGALYFDSNGDAIKSIPIGIYNKGKPVTAWYQYQPLTTMPEANNLLQNILDNNIIQVNDKFMQKAQVVYTGLDFNDISELDLNKSTYKADFYLWFRSLQPDKTQYHFDYIDFINIFDPKDNDIKKGSPLKPEEYLPEKGSKLDKVIINAYRFKTQFKIDFDLHDYPLDQQILPIRFRHNHLTTDKLIYVVDREGMVLDETKTKIQEVFPGWKVVNKGISFFQDTQKNDSTLGNPKQFNLKKRLEYSQFNVEIKIERHVLGFLLKTLLPTLFVLGLGYAVYFTHVFATKMALSMNLIISTSLFHLKLASSALSAVEYNVLIEYVFYIVYILGIFGVVTSLLIDKEELKVKTMKDKLDELRENDKSSKEEIAHIEKAINRGKVLINRIGLTGKIGYPTVVGFVIVGVWIFYQYRQLIH